MVGAVVGSALLTSIVSVVATMLIIFCCCKKMNQKKRESPANGEYYTRSKNAMYEAESVTAM